jgi:hypothetical protein
MLESYEDTPPNYFLMNYNDDNDLNPNSMISTIFIPVLIPRFKNDNQKQSYLFPIEPSLLSHLHSSLTYVNAHERLVIPKLFHFLSIQIVPTAGGVKNFDTFVILITIIIGDVII